MATESWRLSAQRVGLLPVTAMCNVPCHAGVRTAPMLEPTLDTPPCSHSDHQYSWKKISELPTLAPNGKRKAVVAVVA